MYRYFIVQFKLIFVVLSVDLRSCNWYGSRGDRVRLALGRFLYNLYITVNIVQTYDIVVPLRVFFITVCRADVCLGYSI